MEINPYPLTTLSCVNIWLMRTMLSVTSPGLILLRNYASFCYRPLPLSRPLFASWPEQLPSCPLAHDQPLQRILCESVHTYGSYAPFYSGPIPLPHPLLVHWHYHTLTPSHTHTHTHTHTLTSMPNFSHLGWILWSPKSMEFVWSDWATYRAAGHS